MAPSKGATKKPYVEVDLKVMKNTNSSGGNESSNDNLRTSVDIHCDQERDENNSDNGIKNIGKTMPPKFSQNLLDDITFFVGFNFIVAIFIKFLWMIS